MMIWTIGLMMIWIIGLISVCVCVEIMDYGGKY